MNKQTEHQTVVQPEPIRSGYYQADIPGRTEPYQVTYDPDSYATDFR